MSMQLSLVRRASTSVVSTINLQTDGRVLGFIPTASSGKDMVTERCDLLLEQESAATLKAAVNAIETMLSFAKSHPTGPEGVWVLYSPDTDTVWQSRIVNGQVIHDDKANFLWDKYKAVLEIVFERQNYWETLSAVTLELSNGTATNANSAPVDNCQDGSHDLYVEIDSDQVTGVVPTPAILEFENTQNDATLLDDLLVGVLQGDGASTPPTPSALVCEGEGEVDASCSGGEYEALSWADDAVNELTSWTIDSGAFLQKQYRAIVRQQAAVAYTDLWLQARLYAGATLIAETRWMLVTADEELVVIGSMAIPPYAMGEAIDLGNLTLALYEKRASGSGSMNLDYLILMPQDAWRKYGAITGLAYGETLIDDPVRGVLVTDDGVGGYAVTNKVDEGEPLMLRPGVKNYLYFLQQDTDGEATIARTADVVVKIHPRRLTI